MRNKPHALALAAGLAVGLVCGPATALQPGTMQPGTMTGPDTRTGSGSGSGSGSRSSAPVSVPTGATPGQLAEYEGHLEFLANPALGGRYPGTPGIEVAASYIERHYEELGLEPAFPEDGARGVTYRQQFQVGSRSVLSDESLAVRRGARERRLPAGEAFHTLGYSASGEGSGEAVFVGYGIEEGQDGYAGFPDGTDLSGKVAIVARFEPMDRDGRSRWTDGGWTFRAGLASKFAAIADRGAAAILLVTPPMADDPRAGELETLETTRTARSVGVPVFHASAEAVDRLVRAGDARGRDLGDLLRLADRRGTVIDLGGVEVAYRAEIRREPIYTSNIGAILPGRGELAEELIVIGSHYDHVGMGVIGTRSPGELHPGADDNASGTSGNLTAASVLADVYASMPEETDARSVLFLAFSAEESGLIGSRHYVENPIRPLDEHYLMLNMDMIGSYRQQLEAGGVGTGEGLPELVAPMFEASGLDITTALSVGNGRSDHASFDRRQIPNIFFFTGITPTYHSPGDTIDTVNTEDAADIAKMVSRIAFAAAARDEDMAYVDQSGRRRGVSRPGAAGGRGSSGGGGGATEDSGSSVSRMRVRVGIAPGDYSDRGGGILVGDVYEGTSADEAGLKQGDRIVTWNGTEVPTVREWMPLLLEHEPGDTVRMRVLRDDREIEVEMTLQAAKSDG